jgi:hypothetical protein
MQTLAADAQAVDIMLPPMTSSFGAGDATENKTQYKPSLRS